MHFIGKMLPFKGFMFKIVKVFLASLGALFFTALLVPGVSYQRDFRILLAAALIFALFRLLLVPVLRFIFGPLNFLTLGLVSMVVNTGVFWLLNFFVPTFSFSGFYLWGSFVPVWGAILLGAILTSWIFALLERILNV